MKTCFFVALLFFALAAQAAPVAAQSEQPTIYTIVPGDTLWGLSKRFLNDPYYWPNMWAANGTIGNPHFIYPGQRVRVYSDRIEIEPAPAAVAPQAPSQEAPKEVPPPPVQEEQQPSPFSVTGSEGFIMEKWMAPAGSIISIPQNRVMVGTDDIVYTDIGRVHGAFAGDRFSIYKKTGAISHPVTNVILGDRVIPLGELQLSEVEKDASKAIVTKSYQEISPGSFLLPYREKRVTVALKAADRDLTGYIVDSQTGNSALAVRDLVFLDLGTAQGVQPGNMLYIVRDVKPDQRWVLSRIEKLPVDVVGAVVVLQTNTNTSTAVIVKSVDTIYRGDRVEVRKNR
ncbi:LysM peptidoglycan-binding domain-containing protein [Geomonas sp.]|uniref:LysM peptidoglycan-binding domain-containing protein n=1 Tax=Geomonas sp. TaxID=2651584 RepID=UPI002B49D434|nr:LysM peptidoglycan-binding domain-containing protein [Geomonas sp.]HJV36484.1 LysM peptidoglycan-binding domain-containing protein [Geomonas sp.]